MIYEVIISKANDEYYDGGSKDHLSARASRNERCLYSNVSRCLNSRNRKQYHEGQLNVSHIGSV